MSEILVAREAGVLSVTFNRPARRNAITAAMYEAMAAAVREGGADDAVRVILFHGGPDAFTAGNDLEDFVARPPSGADTPVFRFLQAAATAEKPMVAAVNGAAVGIGTTLLLHCDLVYAGENARFALPFVHLGLVPEFASSYLLPRVAGYQRAAEMLLLGEPFGPDRALAAGFVNAVVPPARTLEVATGAARKLAALPPKSVRLTRALMRSAQREAVLAQLEAEGEHFRAMLVEPAAREAFAAFLEKRRPDFSKNNP